MLGLRKGEVPGLTEDDVDLAAGELAISWQLQRVGDSRFATRPWWGCGAGNPGRPLAAGNSRSEGSQRLRGNHHAGSRPTRTHVRPAPR